MTAVFEGEVVESPRRRERNAARSLSVLPPDVQTKVSELSTLSGESQARAVTAMLSHSRTGLLAAVAAQDLPQIVEWKAKGAAVREIAKQLQLGNEIQQDATEFVRRAERGLGVAIREGQELGEIVRKGETAGPKGDYLRNGRVVHVEPLPIEKKPSPTDYLGRGGGYQSAVYALTDGVSDEAFEEALAEAKSEGNLSRANVARKAKAKAAQSDTLEETPHHPSTEATPQEKKQKRLTKHDSTEMLANVNGMLNGIVESLPFIDPTDIDWTDAQNRRVVGNIRKSMAQIRGLLREIEK